MSKTKDEENPNKVERISTLFDCLDSTYFNTNSNKLVDLHLDPRRTRLSDFKVISLLSKGAFGEVYLVSKDDKPYALKRVLKETVNRQPSTALHMEEREILIKARESNFLVFAHCAFQDEGAIYFLMEYFPGGDFTNLLSNFGMEENQIRFYGAEILLALKELHSFNFVHRDLKPENLLITKEGHIKLCDFGSCAMLKDGKIKCDVTIGTPDYVSPEVLCSAEKMSEYGTEVDLWTFGTLLYEMVNEEPPFFSELLEETYERIKEISFSHENGSKELKDLINNLLVKKENRFTIQQVMDHPFFKGIDFNTIYKSTPPRVPKISSIFDVSNFPEANRNICIVKSDRIDYKNFIGFSYDPFFTNEFIKEITLQNLIEEEKNLPELNFKDVLPEKKAENLKSNFLQTETVCLNCKKKENSCLNCKNDCILRGECYFHKQKSNLCLEMNCNKTIQCSFHKRNLSVCFSRKTLTDANLPSKLKKLSINNTSVNKIRNTLGELHYLIEKMYKFKNENAFKKEVKIKKIQIKEYQQKLEEQIVRNTFLEEEIFFLKSEINRLSKKRKESLKLHLTGVLAYKAKSKLENRLVGGEEIELKLENEGLTFKNEFYNLNNVIVNQLSNKELSQMSNKVRNLILSFTFIEIKKKEKEKTNLKVVEENLKKEMKIKEGLEKMLKVMKGKSLEQTQEQLSGTIKRIEFLKNSLEIGRKLTDCSFEEYKESVKKYEFNNHSFKPTTFPENTLCEHCNDLLRGTVLQGLKCDDCTMVVHKKCFVLVKESCEMREAIINGDKWYFMFGCVEDKERIYKAIGGLN